MAAYGTGKRRFLRLADPRYNYSHHRAPAGTIPGIVAVFAALFLCVWFSSQSVKFNYELNELKIKRESLKVQNRMLEFKLQSMMSSESISKIARERYGFISPGEGQVRVIRRNSGFLAGLFKK
ncbi:MAG TPA: hypothetical protein ENN43_08610 [bacterium]|nr:hypothetical protein [bacterium]